MKVVASSVNGMKMPHYERRMLVASRMKEARLNSGLSQQHIANQLHISQATYSRMENAESEPSAIQLATLSGIYHLSILWLMGYPNFVVNATKNNC